MFRRTFLIVTLFSIFFTEVFAQQIKTVCYGATKSYFVDLDDGPNGTIGSTYDWSILEPNSAKIIGNGTNAVSIDWGTTPPGNYTVEVVETSETCMSSTSVLAIRIKSNPNVSAEGSTVCAGVTGLISAYASPVNSTFEYSWTFPTGAIDPGNVSAFETKVGGDYVVTVKDNNGCTSTPTKTSLIINASPSASIVAEGATRFCEGGSLVLSAPKGMSSYLWSKDGEILTEDDSSSRLLKVTSSGNYTVTTTDSFGCSNSAENSIYVDVKPLPVVDIELSGPTEFCFGQSVTLKAISNGDGLIYQWLDKGNELLGQSDSVYIASKTGIFSVNVIDENSCSSTSGIVDVIVRPNPDATISHNSPTTFCAGDNVALSVPVVPGYSYQWSNFNGPILGATNATYIAYDTSNYSIQIIDTNYPTFCSSSAMMPVKVVKKVLPVVSTISGD